MDGVAERCLLLGAISLVIFLISSVQLEASQPKSAYFLPEFALSPQGTFQEDPAGDRLLTYRYDDQASRTTRSDEDREVGWDAWGPWSDCSRTCGGGASYSLRRCLNRGNCEGRSIRYRTCSNTDCPLEAGDFRAQQCSAYNDVKYHGRTYDWSPVTDDAALPCALRCQARGRPLVAELAPKVLDGTRCKAHSLDMCINGICQEVGCDRQLGSSAREDNCGVCAGDGSTCRLMKGQVVTHISPEEQTMLEVPLGSRSVRVTARGPGVLVLETHTLHGQGEEHILHAAGPLIVGNTTVDVQRGPDRQTLRANGPLATDFIFKVKYVAPRSTVVEFMFYQPIRYQWRETDFFPCTVTCGGGYQLNSAECVDTRHNLSTSDHHCHAFPENKKPKPKLKECNMDLCPESSDGFKEVMPYDHFQPLPRWEQNPWTICSKSCGGGSQTRSVSCVEENVHGYVSQSEEWRCMHSPQPAMQQDCNAFDCPLWAAMEWSQCTVTCGRGLRYRVVLCLDHRGQHTGGCTAGLKPHVKEDCLVPVTCHRPQEKLPVEAKLPWLKQAQELEETQTASEDPAFITEPWLSCSTTCGPGLQKRWVRCRALLSFAQTEVDLPDEECDGERLPTERACNLGPCGGGSPEGEPLYRWKNLGFTECSSTCAAGTQVEVVKCLSRYGGEVVDQALCDSSTRPIAAVRVCHSAPCPPRWEFSMWGPCSATCGVGIQARNVHCSQLWSLDPMDSFIVGEGECQEYKPSVLRACNQVDCPPAWQTKEWQECSQTCGAGIQRRKVYCKQLMSDGGFVKLANDACPGDRPLSHQPCAQTDCPPQLAGGDWSQCSVSCGTGVQQRKPVCHRLTSMGHLVTLDRAACIDLVSLPVVRACRLSPCAKRPKVAWHWQPQGLQRIYIQSRQEKRVFLTAGGLAYLLPRSSVVIRCPALRFPKLHIRRADGRTLHSCSHTLPGSGRVVVTRSGSLKIQRLEAGDIGLYRCQAGLRADIFVLRLIRADGRLMEPPAESGEKADASGNLTKLDLRVGKWNRMSQSWQSWSRRNNFNPEHSQMRETAFLRVLDDYLMGALLSAHSLQLPGRPPGTGHLRGVYSLEEFVELVRNLSLLASREGKGGNQLTAGQNVPCSTIEKMTWPKDMDNATKGILIDRKPNSLERSPEEGMGRPSYGARKPVIIQLKGNAPMSFQNNVRISIGRMAYLTNTTRSVVLDCLALGVPKPRISWTKDGLPLRFTERALWDTAGNLRISNLTVGDEGAYRCTATNELGSDSKTSQLRLAAWSHHPAAVHLRQNHPPLLPHKMDVCDLKSGAPKVVVGGDVTVRQGADVTLDCPVSGVPWPNVSWSKEPGGLGENAALWPNGSLVLHNVSVESLGTYVCLASNPLGKSVASSRLMMMGLTRGHSPHHLAVIRDMSHPRALMASHHGGSATVRPGDIVRIGCPVQPSRRDTIHWYFQNRTLRADPGLQHRTLFGGRVLEVHALPGTFAGHYQCQAATILTSASAWIHVVQEVFQWSQGNWTECSVSCGNQGTRSRKLCCLNSKGEEVFPSLCQPQPRPANPSHSCNVQDCPPSWVTTVWSECLIPCGRGFRRRQVSCRQKEAGGLVRVLPQSACKRSARPVDTEHCRSQTCTGWQAGLRSQCSKGCLSPVLPAQSRPVTCRYLNGSAPTTSDCKTRTRPPPMRACRFEAWHVQWRAGSWRVCSAACGGGFQSRRVECVHSRSNQIVADRRCSGQRRPFSWQQCRGNSSCSGSCRDTTHYCLVVKRLDLCAMDLYKQRCCMSCQGLATVGPPSTMTDRDRTGNAAQAT